MKARIENYKASICLKDYRNFLRRVLISVFLLSLGVVHSSQAQEILYRSTPFKDGEVLRYKVKWGIIRLGTVENSQQVIDSLFFPSYLIQLQAKSTKLKVFLFAHSPISYNFVLEKGKKKEAMAVYRYDF